MSLDLDDLKYNVHHSSRKHSSAEVESDEESLETGQPDVLTEVIGEIGPWQLTWGFLIGLTIYIHSWQMLANKFLTYTPEAFWCARPDWVISDFPNITAARWHEISSPAGGDACLRYDIVQNRELVDRHFAEWITVGLNSTPHEDESLLKVEKCTGWEYDQSVFQNTAVMRWNLVCDDKSVARYIQIIFFIGNMIGVLISGGASDRFGRRISFLVSYTIFLAAGVSIYFVSNMYVWIALRFVIGASSISFNTIFSVFILELTNGNWRSILTHMFSEMSWILGHISLGGVVYMVRDIKQFELVIGVSGLPWLLLWFVMPESPRWLLSHGDVKKAKPIIEQACLFNRKPRGPIKQLLEMEKDNTEDEVRHSILDLLSYPGIRRNMIIMCFCWMSFSMGYFGLIYNTPATKSNMFWIFVFPAVIAVPIVALQPFIENYLGRKAILTSGLLLGGSALLSTLFFAENKEVLIGLSLCGTSSLGLAFSVGYTLCKELMPTVLRTTTLGTASACARIGAILSPLVAMLDVYGSFVPLFVYGCVVFVAGFASIWIWPETKGIPLPESIEEAEHHANTRNTWLLPACAKPFRQHVRRNIPTCK